MHKSKKIFVIAIVGILVLGCLTPSTKIGDVTVEKNRSRSNITTEKKEEIVKIEEMPEVQQSKEEKEVGIVKGLTGEEKAEATKLALNDSVVREKLKDREYKISQFVWVLVSYEKPDSFKVRVIGGSVEGLKENEKKIRNYFNASAETMPMEILPAVVFRVEETRPYLLYVLVDLHKRKSLGIIWEFPIKVPPPQEEPLLSISLDSPLFAAGLEKGELLLYLSQGNSYVITATITPVKLNSTSTVYLDIVDIYNALVGVNITLNPSSVVLEPNETTYSNITITVDPNAPNGTYLVSVRGSLLKERTETIFGLNVGSGRKPVLSTIPPPPTTLPIK